MSRYLKAAPTAANQLKGGESTADIVATVIADVRSRGDVAVREYSEKFDKWSPDSFRLDRERIEEIVSSVPRQVLDDIRTVQANVRSFAQHQRDSLHDFEVETMPGVFLGQRNLPVSAAGVYVPGGRYPLVASAHMTVVTAKVAGVPKVLACTPPIRGEIPAATIAAMSMAGADEIYLLGGVQAVAAMAVGTETIDQVDMLAGPGNAYVAEAKRQLFGQVGIDLFAGPTEILVVADAAADPFVVAVDLLSQAEHGPDSPAILVTTSEQVAIAAMAHVDRLLPTMPTRDFAEPAWRNHGQVIMVDNLEEAFSVADSFASEHVQVLTSEPRRALDKMSNYGALFLGEGTCVSYGDKVIGTNHTLPTGGAARYTGGLWVGKYLKTVTYQEVTNQESSAELGTAYLLNWTCAGQVDFVEAGPVGGVDYPRTYQEFRAWFPDDVACADYLAKLRWPGGFRCPVCGGDRAWRTSTRHWKCAACGRKTSVTAGTIFHRTRTPLSTWFAAIWLVTSQKNGSAAQNVHDMLGLGSYETAWVWLHKLRRAMVRRDRELLAGVVEVDESFIGGRATGKPGAATDKVPVMIAVENVGHQVGRKLLLGRVRLGVADAPGSKQLVDFARTTAAPGSLIRTDGARMFRVLAEEGFTHEYTSGYSSPEPGHVTLPGPHRVASLLKRWNAGTHHYRVEREHLQYYLDEFAFRFNRRSSRARGMLFYRLLQQSVNTDPHPLTELIGGTATAGRAEGEHVEPLPSNTFGEFQERVQLSRYAVTRSALRARGPRRALRGPRSLRRHAGREVRWRYAPLGRGSVRGQRWLTHSPGGPL